MPDEVILYCVHGTHVFSQVEKNERGILVNLDLRSQKSFVDIGEKVYIKLPLHSVSATFQGPEDQKPPPALVVGVFPLPLQHTRGKRPDMYITLEDLTKRFAVRVDKRDMLGKFKGDD